MAKWRALLIWQVSKEVEIEGPETEEEALDKLYKMELTTNLTSQYCMFNTTNENTFRVEDLEEVT